MPYQKLVNPVIQDLGYEYIEIEFILDSQNQKKSPEVEEQPKYEKYVLSAPISRKELWKDRKMREKSSIKFNRPVSTFSVAERRISY